MLIIADESNLQSKLLWVYFLYEVDAWTAARTEIAILFVK